MPQEIFLKKFFPYIYSSTDIIRILRYGEDGEIALKESERERLECLFGGECLLRRSVGFMEGDRVFVESGALKGREGLIKHISRHNKRAVVELEMFGGTIRTSVALEIVSKR